MAAYSGNILRMKAPQDPSINPGGPDDAHAAPSGPEGVPDFRAVEITVPGDLGTEYAGLTMDDGVSRAITAGQPGLGWNAPESAMVPIGSGSTPAGYAPNWSTSDPHNAQVDTSYAAAARGAIAGSPYHGQYSGAHAAGDDTEPYSRANPVGVAGTSFLERLVDFPKEMWAEPSGAGADKFIGGTNSYHSSNPDGDNYTNRWGARVHWGFETDYFVHTPMYQDKTPQTYDRRTSPVTSRDPLVGGAYANTPSMGQLAANPWLTELGESAVPGGYGVPVDGVV
ncbi:MULTISPECIES: hypothetical protein [Streptomyces]|nr:MULTISPECIES: hypothetical protein [Streptomyces]